MTDHGDQLREAFETHERLAPDPAAVYARVQELARTYHRRRRGAQAAGGAVLGAGLIAGAMNLPTLLPGSSHDTVAVVAPAAVPSPSVSPTPSADELQKAWDAYFGAGYDYNDAVKLAKIWHSTDEVGNVKAEAGRRLLAGQTLPFKPNPKNVAQAKVAAQVDAFFAAGYDYDDAVKLAKLWHLPDASHAKVAAGKKLLAGEKLPIKPTPVDPGSEPAAAPINAFFGAGYTYDDAVQLAKLWHTSDPYQAKIDAGKKLLAGETLPIKP
jgi:hypothetical protein